jgi:hypothetical protein
MLILQDLHCECCCSSGSVVSYEEIYEDMKAPRDGSDVGVAVLTANI